MKITWVVLTFNRKDVVERSMAYNIRTAGRIIDELIWVDNGSTEDLAEVMSTWMPDVSVLNKTNLGVSKGYNRGITLATGSHVLITGCDRLMPWNWLKTLEAYFETIENTGCVSMYSAPLERCKERLRQPTMEPEMVNGLPIVRAMPFGARMMRRELIKEAGHLLETFGLYGHEDIEAAARYERVCNERGWLYYTIPGMVAQHLGVEDSPEYKAFKKQQSQDPSHERILQESAKAGFPYYNPFL